MVHRPRHTRQHIRRGQWLRESCAFCERRTAYRVEAGCSTLQHLHGIDVGRGQADVALIADGGGCPRGWPPGGTKAAARLEEEREALDKSLEVQVQ